MLLEKYILHEGAIFIADAHENAKRKYFDEFLTAVEKEKIKAPQIFLMGDMFDLLIGDISFTCNLHKEYIKRIDCLAQKIPIYYFEGNHDFNVKKLFTHVKVFSFFEQPIIFTTPFGNIALSHGDKYSGFRYTIYTYIIRSFITLFFLNFLDIVSKNKISQLILKKLENKKICTHIDNFKEKIRKKLASYGNQNIRNIAEGHYHQNKKLLFNDLIYHNFSSFACDKSYFVVQLTSGIKFKEENLRGRNV